MADDDTYVNIRQLLGPFIGGRVVDIVQHDEEDFRTEGACYVELLFENGGTIRFHITPDGTFDVHLPD